MTTGTIDTREKVYFDTSAFDYLRKHVQWKTFLGTRELQELRGRELLISPVTLWELFLAQDERDADFLVYCAQHFFSPRLLATPTELVVRYLENAYPENRINYEVFTDLEMGSLWWKMTTDPLATMIVDRELLKQRTSLLRKISRNLRSVIRFPDCSVGDEWLSSIAEVVDTYYRCLKDDGFPLPASADADGSRLLGKSVVLVIFVLFVLRLDFEPGIVTAFWERRSLDPNDPTELLSSFLESYPYALSCGPLLEIAMMVFTQLGHPGRTNRGLFLDSLHAVYTPYVHTILTADEGFFALAKQAPHFERKVRHIGKVGLREVSYVARKP